jgi:hypothetical protein
MQPLAFADIICAVAVALMLCDVWPISLEKNTGNVVLPCVPSR